MSLLKRIPLFLLLFFATLTLRASVDSALVNTSQNTICYDSCNGWAIIQVFSSTSSGPFRIVWKGNNLPGSSIIDTVTSSDTIFDLCSGNYSVEVVDISDGSKTSPEYFSIVKANILSVNYQVSKPTCHDSVNGSINALLAGGTFPYKYQWSTGPNDTLQTLSLVGNGIYGLSITDADGCAYNDSVWLKGPDTLKVNIGQINTTCKDVCDGKVFTNVEGGSPGYSYLWSSSDTTEAISGLCPGKAVVTITDINGCLVKDSVIITEPDSLKATFVVNDALCFGACNGEVTSLVTGGSRPYSYSWSGYNSSDSLLSNVCAGFITTTVWDANGCYYTKNISISQPAKLDLQPTINASTCGICDGDISVSVTGGSGVYRYLWVGQKAEDTISSIDSLCPGIYRLAITDGSLCSDTFNIVLNDDTAGGITDLTFVLSDASCENVCNGAAAASVIGGTSPYAYLWFPGSQTDSVLTGLCAGSYSLKVTDASGCQRIELIELKSTSNLTATYSSEFNGCQGDCIGEIALSVSSGLPPYNFAWTGSNSSGSGAGNLCAGSYPFKITDDNGCVFMDTAILSEPDSIHVVLNTMDETCANSCDGTASLSLSGGVGPYTAAWSNGASGMAVNGLCSGSYWVDIEDASGCVKRKNFTINLGAAISGNGVVANADCRLNNGSITLSPSGGTAPYTFLWFNNTLASNIGGLGTNTTAPYTVLITDANGCSKTDSFIVSDKNGPPVNYSIVDESCYGACDGSITMSFGGGTGKNYFYLWIPQFGGLNSANLSSVGGLCAGKYFAGIAEGGINGCITLNEVQIKKGNKMTLDLGVSEPTCINSCDASISLNVSGGIPPYNILWSNGSSNKVISGLCAGTYSVNITDASGCLVNQSVVIENPEALSLSLNTSNLSCYNVCDGMVSSTVSGGKAPFTYNWSNGSTTKNISNLCQGNYWLQVTDANGCSSVENISIGNGVPMIASFTKIGADCGKSNGSITVTASAGNGLPYTYLWSNGNATSMAANLPAGIHKIRITDNAGCSQEFTTTLGNVGGPLMSDTTYETSCAGSCDGAAKASASGAAIPYFYQWYDAQMQTGDSATSLCKGIYYYSATDSLGCVSYDSVIIAEPAKISISSSINQISCPGANDGSILLSVSGGQGPFTYLWSNGDTAISTDSLVQGIYSVIVTDSTGCTSSDTFDLSDPVAIGITFQITNASCFGSCDGSLKAIVSGGIGSYTYQWNDPLNQATNIAAGLCSGYTKLTVTDSKACTASDSALITSPSAISATPSPSNPTCNGASNGSISLVINGGSAPYQVLWSNGMTGASINGLAAGNYGVTIIDANSCVYQNSYLLNDPALLSVTVNVTKPACNNNNGSAAATVSGGSGNYSFNWSTVPTKTTSTVTGLWAGIYTLIVTDNNTGCVREKTVIVNNTGTTALNFVIDDETCPRACDGRISVDAGTGNFSFLWDDPLGQTDSVATDLCIGLYTVKVKDTITGCVIFDTASIAPSGKSLSVISVKRADCYGDCNGSATVDAKGMLGPIIYSWNTIPQQLTQTASQLCAGEYTAEASDSANCIMQALVKIEEPDSLVVDLSLLSATTCAGTCNGRASVNISGGTGPYSIYWNGKKGGNTTFTLCAGNNTIDVYDLSGCSSSLSFDVIDATPIAANAIVGLPSCASYNGSISVNPSGGSGPYFYHWSTGARTNVITDLFAGIYTVKISDAKGCSKSFTYFLNNPNAPALTFDQNTVKCNGDCNGVARVTPLGGVGPYAYLWNHVPISTLDSLTGLCSGFYFVKVTDATGCIAFGADTITEPPVFTAVLNKLTDGCGGFCEGEARIIPQGGTSPYNYSWNTTPPQGASTATGLCAGMVAIVVTDANDCVYSDSVQIIPPPALLIDSTIYDNATCFTNSDGKATVYFQGGTMPVRFQWSNTQTGQTATSLKAGIYVIALTDTNGCNAFDTVTIGVKDTVLVQAFVDSFFCIGSEALLMATGQGATLYNWFADSSGSLKSIGNGDSIYYLVEDTVTIYLRGENDVTPPCYDLDTAFIVGIPPPLIVASSANTTIERGSSTELLASPFLFNGNYAWTPSSSLNDTASIAPIASPDETTTYIVIGTNEFGCWGSDTITIYVSKDNNIINGFSPNGDGVNDRWEIPTLKDYPKVIVEVYNRWGEQVFRSEGYKKPWDGTYKGVKLPNASYYYVIDFYGDGEKVETGAVTILY